MVKPPVAAVLLAASVSVLVPEVLAGLRLAVTPLGMPEAVKLTLPVKPFCGVTVMMLDPLELCVKLMLAGVADSKKSGAAFTVRLMVVEFVKLPDVPVIVTMDVPVAAVFPAVSVSVLVPVVLLGLNEAVTPLGNPDAVRLTVPEKPPNVETVTVLLPLAP